MGYKLRPRLPIGNKEYNLHQDKKEDYTYFYCDTLKGIFYEKIDKGIEDCLNKKSNLKEIHFVFEFGYNVRRYLYTTKTNLLKEFNEEFVEQLIDECQVNLQKDGHPRDKDNQKFLGYK